MGSEALSSVLTILSDGYFMTSSIRSISVLTDCTVYPAAIRLSAGARNAFI